MTYGMHLHETMFSRRPRECRRCSAVMEGLALKQRRTFAVSDRSGVKALKERSDARNLDVPAVRSKRFRIFRMAGGVMIGGLLMTVS